MISAGEQASSLQLAQLAIWNRALAARLAVDPAGANAATGALAGVPPARFALLRGVELAGERIVNTSLGALVELDRPVRLAATVEGVAGDGWAGAEAVYRRFGGGVERVRVRIGRRSWGGEDVPGAVTVRVGPLEGELVERAQVVIHAPQETEVVVDAPPAPFRIVVTTTPTFSPSDFGLEDTRELGAQLSFEPLTG